MNIFNNNKLSLFPTPGQSANGFRDVKATGSSVPESIKAPVITPQSLGSGLGSVAAPVKPQLQSYESASAMAVPVITTKLTLNKQIITNLNNSETNDYIAFNKTTVEGTNCPQKPHKSDKKHPCTQDKNDTACANASKSQCDRVKCPKNLYEDGYFDYDYGIAIRPQIVQQYSYRGECLL